jgi:hypothetical protein
LAGAVLRNLSIDFAIAGVAKSLQRLLDDECFVGHWKKDLPWNLVWTLSGIEGELLVPPKYRCMKSSPSATVTYKVAGPSWSWASPDYGSAVIDDLHIYE